MAKKQIARMGSTMDMVAFYEACIEQVSRDMQRTDITEERKRLLGITEERLSDLTRCLMEVKKAQRN